MLDSKGKSIKEARVAKRIMLPPCETGCPLRGSTVPASLYKKARMMQLRFKEHLSFKVDLKNYITRA